MLTEPTGHGLASYRMRRFIYVSTSQMDGDPGELRRLVEHSGARNDQVGITGMLWFDGVRFVQVLEGDHDVIDDTIGRIRIDTRHSDIKIIADRKVSTRMFGNWAMRHADTDSECTEKTAFLAGYTAKESPKLAREIVEILLASE